MRIALLTFFVTASTVTAAVHSKLDGVFLEVYNHSAFYSTERWHAELTAMKAVDVDFLIVESAASWFWPNYTASVSGPNNPNISEKWAGVHSFYPSKIGQGIEQIGDNIIGKIMGAAKKIGLKVYLGLAFIDIVYNNFTADQELQLSLQVADELWAMYGGSNSPLVGFYTVLEEGNQPYPLQPNATTYATMFLGPLARKAKSLSTDLELLASPWYRDTRREPTYLTPARYAEYWDTVFTLVPEFSILAPQDGVGAGNNSLATVSDFLTALEPVAAKHNKVLWSNVEAMQTNGTWCAQQRAAGKICWPNCHSRLPAPFDRFVSQLALEGSLIQRRGGKLISWEWESYLSPFSDVCNGVHAASAAENYRHYVHYLRDN